MRAPVLSATGSAPAAADRFWDSMTYEDWLQLEPVRVGVPPADRRRLRTFTAGAAGRERGSSCPICLEAIAAQSTVCKLHCQHTFHQVCLWTWLDESKTCPVCRKEVS